MPPDPPPPPAPLALDEVLRLGATLHGRPVRVLSVETADGRRQRLELPAVAEGVGDDGLSRTQRRIMEALRAADRPLTRKALAGRLNLKDPRGRFGDELRALVTLGRVTTRGQEYADDPAKLAESGDD